MDPKLVLGFESRLPALGAAGHVNVDELENLTVVPVERVATEPHSSTEAPTQPLKKKKKKKKPLLPKNFNPAVPPNPERWLKKSDRSDYKPKKVKGRRGQDDEMRRGVQGVVTPAPKAAPAAAKASSNTTSASPPAKASPASPKAGPTSPKVVAAPPKAKPKTKPPKRKGRK